MSTEQLQIRLLGPLEVARGDVVLELPPSRKARALLAYLVATGRPHARSALCDLFWQEVQDPRAALRWALSRLRGALEGGMQKAGTQGEEGTQEEGKRDPFTTSGERVAFDPHGVQVDLHLVEGLSGAGLEDADISDLERAATAFRGEFLEGLELPECHQFQAWCLGTRERLRTERMSLVGTLVRRLHDRPDQALPHALARLRLDPYDENAYIQAMDLLGRLGRTQRALELYEQCRRMLADYLEVDPSPELERARARLRSARPGASGAREGARKRVDGGGQPTDGPERLAEATARLPPPEHLPPPGDDEPPLVGRAAEMEALREFLDGLGSEGPAPSILLTGEPGIGKSRLLRELVGEVRSARGWVLSGPVFESEGIRPYGPWTDLLRKLPPEVLGPEATAGALGVLADPAPRPGRSAPVERGELFDAVAALLRRLVEARAPGVVILDDLQWLDPSSAALLHYVSRTLASLPLGFAFAARAGEVEPGSAVATTLHALEAAGRLRRLPIDRLGPDDTARLVRAVAGLGQARRDQTRNDQARSDRARKGRADRAEAGMDASSVFTASEGNPLFVLALATGEGDGAPGRTTSIEAELADRLDRLEPEAFPVLTWAAALGRAFDVPTLVRVLGQPPPVVVQAIDLLERRGILRATGSDRFDFTHALLRDAAYRRASEPALRAIHRAIAESLDAVGRGTGGLGERTGQDPPETRDPGAVARHAELGGLQHLAARAFAEAADDSIWVFAFDEAAELARRGLAQAAHLGDEARVPTEMELLRIYSFRGMAERRPPDLEDRVRQVTREARDLGRHDVVAMGHGLAMELAYQRGAFDDAEQSSLRSAEAGRRGEPLTAVRSLAETAACLLILDQAPEDARRLSSEASTLADELGVELDALALARALLHHHDGELDRAREAFQEVIRLGKRTRDRWWETPARTRITMVELDRRDFRAARERADEAREVAARMNDEVEEAFGRGLAAVASWHLALERSGNEGSHTYEDETEAPPGDLDATPDSLGSAPDDLQAALDDLRTLDSLWEIAHLEAYAAEVELLEGCTEQARTRAEATLEVARTLRRPSLLAVAHGLLAQAEIQAGRSRDAEERLVSAEVTGSENRISHRARQVVRRARDALP